MAWATSGASVLPPWPDSVEQAEAAACGDLALQLRWEAMLAYAYTSNAALLEADRPRFIEVHPDLLQDEALDYLVKRRSVGSVYVRSRVLDFLWVHGGPTRRRHAVTAGTAYLEVAALEAAKASTESFAWLHVGDALVRAAALAKAANQSTTTRAVAEVALEFLQRLSAAGTFRYVLDMGLALTEVADRLTVTEQQAVEVALVDAAVGFSAGGNHHLARAAMTVRRRFAIATKQPDDALRRIDIDIARSSLQEGVKGRQSVSRNGHELSVGSDNTDTSDFSCLSSTFRSVPLPTQAFADTLVTDFTDSFRGR